MVRYKFSLGRVLCALMVVGATVSLVATSPFWLEDFLWTAPGRQLSETLNVGYATALSEMLTCVVALVGLAIAGAVAMPTRSRRRKSSVGVGLGVGD